MARAILAISALLLAGCTVVPPPVAPGAGCAVLSSSDWRAWVNAMPGPGSRPTLVVTGNVTVPTGGYTFAWTDWRVMESYPVQVAAELRPLPPAGPATQALVTHEVRGELPIDPPVGSVSVRCGGRVLATIAPVETAQ